MNRPRIYSDFNGPYQPHYMLLHYIGTLKDLNCQKLVLREGLLVTVYSDFDDEHDLEIDGIVCFGSASGSQECWHVKTDPKSLRHVKVERTDKSPYTLPCFNCSANIYEHLNKRRCPKCSFNTEHARQKP